MIHEALTEIQQIVSSTLGFTGSKVITRATKMARYDWRDLIRLGEQGSTPSLETPFVVLRLYKGEPSDWGMQNKAYTYAIDIIYVEKNSNRIETTVSIGATSATQTLASTLGIFEGQFLYFDTADIWLKVLSIAGNDVTLSASVTTTTDERVFGETVRDVEVLIHKLLDALAWGGNYTNFQIVEESSTDVSDMNYVNNIFFSANYPLFAGILSLRILVGETYA